MTLIENLGKTGIKKQSCLSLNSEIKYYSFILARLKGYENFSKYVEDLLLMELIKNRALFEYDDKKDVD